MKCFSEDLRALLVHRRLFDDERSLRNAPMWHHYGDGGRGVALKFDREKLLRAFDNHNDLHYGPVGYFGRALEHSSNVVDCADHDGRLSLEEATAISKQRLLDEFFTKHDEWSYEFEFRVIAFGPCNRPLMVSFEDALLEVIIGNRFPVKHKEDLIDFCKILPQGVGVRVLEEDGLSAEPLSIDEISRWEVTEEQGCPFAADDQATVTRNHQTVCRSPTYNRVGVLADQLTLDLFDEIHSFAREQHLRYSESFTPTEDNQDYWNQTVHSCTLRLPQLDLALALAFSFSDGLEDFSLKATIATSDPGGLPSLPYTKGWSVGSDGSMHNGRFLPVSTNGRELALYFDELKIQLNTMFPHLLSSPLDEAQSVTGGSTC